MADVHIVCPAPREDELEMMRDKMLAYIFPNTPMTADQKAAFEKACKYQLAHDKTVIAKMGNTDLPDGVTGFEIGDFSMTFEAGAISSRLTKKTVCPAAHGVLLSAGLLYKGVERPW